MTDQKPVDFFSMQSEPVEVAAEFMRPKCRDEDAASFNGRGPGMSTPQPVWETPKTSQVKASLECSARSGSKRLAADHHFGQHEKGWLLLSS
jgi:hypothetical protein